MELPEVANRLPSRRLSRVEMSTSAPPVFFRIDDHIATAAQPDASAFPWLAGQGFRAVLNLNGPTARNYRPDEAALAAAAGLRYVHHPVDCSRLTPALYEAFREQLAPLLADGPVLVHCAANVKSTGLMHVFRVRELGHDPERAEADLEKLPGLEPKWRAFFEQMGVTSESAAAE